MSFFMEYRLTCIQSVPGATRITPVAASLTGNGCDWCECVYWSSREAVTIGGSFNFDASNGT